jgi:hypothetical protein
LNAAVTKFTVANRVPTLLAIVAGLQMLDWHSTLSAAQNRLETNKLINWLGHWIGFAFALSAIKSLLIACLLVGFLYWRKHKGIYDTEFVVCLSTVALVYGAVVFNNYLS